MLHPEYKYVGFKNLVTTKTSIVNISSITVSGRQEFYQSIYRFDDNILSLDSLSAIPKGTKFYSDYLVFDIDNKNLELAFVVLNKLTNWLDNRIIGYEKWFSGAKGFHVLVPTVQFMFEPTDDESILKRMAMAIAINCNIDIDEKIYNVSRIFRMPDSINLKTGLFKIPLKDNFSNDLASIKIMAESPQINNYPDPDDYGLSDVLVGLYKGVMGKVRINREILPTEDYKETNLFNKVKEGDRNDALYKLARKLARRSIGESDAISICGWWCSTLDNPLTEREISKTVMSAYTKGMNELIDETNFKEHFFDAKRCLSGVFNIISNMNKNIVRTGYKFIDDYTMGIYKGDVVFIIARPGNFKTCFLSCILRSISQQTGGKTLLFSMEMGYDRLSLRHMQSAEKMTQEQVIEAIKRGHKFETFKEQFKNVVVISLSSLSIDMIIGLIDYYKEEYGEISAIGFDYLSLFRGCANNTETTARYATEIKTRVAKGANAPVFCLVQARRNYEGDGGDVEIDRQAGKDSSSIEDSADYMIGLWGKKYGRILKSRAFNSTKYNENPYFTTGINKEYMSLDTISILEDFEKPEFKKPNHQGD